MKSRIILLTSVILTVLLVGCANQPTTILKTSSPKIAPSVKKAPATLPKATPKVANKVHTTQWKATLNVININSIVNTPIAFEKAISSKGTRIVTITKNLTINKNLIVDGKYNDGKKNASGKYIGERKINLYRQDKDKHITAKLSLTVPKLTINSPQTNIEHGTFKGSIYVSSRNFHLIDATVKGNVYFTTNEAKHTFRMDTKSKVTGKLQLLKPFKTNLASVVSNRADFEKAISNNGTCIIVILKNITTDKNLIVNGEYKSGKKDARGKYILERKIDLYRRNKCSNINDRLCLSAPKLTVNSPQTIIEHGTFKGNIYVSSKKFHLIDAKVIGNIYFTTNEAKSTFKMDTNSEVIGKQELRK